MRKIIEINHLTKHYGKHRGVSDISFSVNKGDIFGFLGPNGAGKSTTIRSMLGLIKYQSGIINVCGLDSVKDREEMLARVGYMPSESWFYPNMTVKDLLKLDESVRFMDCSGEREKLCERLQVNEKRKISELSLGNRKKVNIVCAMQHRPELFIFDEPTSGLDPLIQNEFFTLIHEYVDKGATCMLSTHVLSEVRNHCNRVAIMREGKIMCIDTIENLMKSNAKRIKLTRNGDKLDYLYRGNMNEIYKELIGDDIQDILIEEPSIEEIFMHYYERGNV